MSQAIQANYRVRIVAIALLFICTVSCTKSDSDDTAWFELSSEILKYGNANDVDALVREISLSDSALLNKVVEQALEVNQQLKGVTTMALLPQDEIHQIYEREANIFVHSYNDLFDGQPACVSRLSNEDLVKQGAEKVAAFNVIIWVKKDQTLYGIKIDEVVKTSEGLKVNSWIGSHGPKADAAELQKKRADLVSDTCEYPDRINYQL